jgi:hypothetical protein
MAAIVPKLNHYGNSFADKVFGQGVEEATTKGDIITSSLGNSTMGDLEEFSFFEETVKDFILARLGFPVVRVELTPFQIKSCIDEAITKLYYHAPMWTTQFCSFQTTGGANLYELPTYILDNMTYCAYKKTLLSIQGQAGTLEFDFFIKYFQDNFLFSDFQVSDFYILQSHLEMIRKVLGQEGSFDVVNNKYLQVYPTPISGDQTVILEYRALDSGTMHPAYKNFIQKYALACAKGILGEIRGKYQSLPSPGGGASLNGQVLVQAGEQEKQKLEEALISEFEEPPRFSTY